MFINSTRALVEVGTCHDDDDDDDDDDGDDDDDDDDDNTEQVELGRVLDND